MARREEETGSGDGARARLDEPRREALRKQIRHPYITGQGLEPPHDRDRQRAGRDNRGSDTPDSGPHDSPGPSDSPDP